jgi:phosphate transport system permease protein
MDRLARRKLVSRAAAAFCLAFAALACLPLLSVLWELWQRGHAALSWEFLSSLPEPPSVPGGGIVHAIVGTGMVVGIGAAIGAPVGTLAGIWLSEYGSNRLGGWVRTTLDAMAGMPSIVAGLFGYGLVVTRFGFSAWAGGVALSVLMLPLVARTTEESLRVVPLPLREASLALGAPRWKTTLQVVLPAAWGGIATALLLSVSRIAGETAPLLLTVLTSFFLVTDPGQPVATLPTLIYSYGKNPAPKLQAQAWGAALVLIGAILALNLLVRLLSRKRRFAT